MESSPTPGDQLVPDPSLEEQAINFASRVDATVRDTLGVDESTIRSRSHGHRLLVTMVDPRGVALHVDGRIVYRLKVHFWCAWNDAQSYLAVQKSAFIIVHERYREPIAHFDYQRNAYGVPASHVNVHTHHPAFREAMKDAGSGSRARRSKGQVGKIHLPTGGHRFRPCLEDVLEMLIVDFKIDCAPSWKASLQAGRAHYKVGQLAAAVNDNPAAAIAALRRMGYHVEWPPAAGDEPGAKASKLRAF